MNFASLLRSVSAQLGSDSEARWLLEHAANLSSSELAASFAVRVPPDVESAVSEMVSRRLEGEPLQYLLGTWQFRTLEVAVDRRVLIPRPETEVVVEYALAELTRLVDKDPTIERNRHRFVAADLGTGSGVVALSLAAENSRAQQCELEIWGTDSSADALQVAQENLDHLSRYDDEAARRVRLVSGDWYEALPPQLVGGIDLIVSNPPYVSDSEWRGLDPVVRDHEPRTALVAGPTGLEALSSLILLATKWLTPDGSLVLEISPGQASAAVGLAESVGFVDVEVHPDLSGLPRALVARRSCRTDVA